MENVFRICLFLSSLINLTPAVLALLPQKIATSYGIAVPNQNYELLLRHRAVLFAIVGGILLYAAIQKKYYHLATLLGLISMVSFLLLFYLVDGPINKELTKVMYIDVLGICILLMGFAMFKFKK